MQISFLQSYGKRSFLDSLSTRVQFSWLSVVQWILTAHLEVFLFFTTVFALACVSCICPGYCKLQLYSTPVFKSTVWLVSRASILRALIYSYFSASQSSLHNPDLGWAQQTFMKHCYYYCFYALGFSPQSNLPAHISHAIRVTA